MASPNHQGKRKISLHSLHTKRAKNSPSDRRARLLAELRELEAEHSASSDEDSLTRSYESSDEEPITSHQPRVQIPLGSPRALQPAEDPLPELPPVTDTMTTATTSDHEAPPSQEPPSPNPMEVIYYAPSTAKPAFNYATQGFRVWWENACYGDFIRVSGRPLSFKLFAPYHLEDF